MIHCIWLTPACRSFAMLFNARLTTDVSICASRTPSDDASNTRRGRLTAPFICAALIAMTLSFALLFAERDLGREPRKTHPFSGRSQWNFRCHVVNRPGLIG